MHPRKYIEQIQRQPLVIPNDNLNLLSTNRVQGLEDWIIKNSVNHSRGEILSCLKNIKHKEIIKEGDPIIVVSHQPTLFSYTGVYAQFLLADSICHRLKKENPELKPVIVYLCLDSDDALDRRIKTAHLPIPSGRKGTLPLSYPVSKVFKNRPQYFIPSVSNDTINGWQQQLNGTFGQLQSTAPNFRNELKDSHKKMSFLLSSLYEGVNKKETKTYSDFSKNILMSFVEKITFHDVIPVNFSDLMKYSDMKFLELLENWSDIEAIIKNSVSNISNKGVDVTCLPKSTADPAWIICSSCGFRNSTDSNNAQSVIKKENIKLRCSSCRLSLFDGKVLPKVVLEDILGALLTDADLVLTYGGSSPHVLLAAEIFPILFNRHSPIYTSHPKQFFGGVIDKVCIELGLFRTKKISLSDGRDPLLFASEMEVSLQDYQDLWGDHFNNQLISDVMIHPHAMRTWNSLI